MTSSTVDSSLSSSSSSSFYNNETVIPVLTNDDSSSSPWSSWWIFFVVVFGIIAIERTYAYLRRAYRKHKGLEGFQPIQMMNEFNDGDDADINEIGYGYSGPHSQMDLHHHNIHVYGDEKNRDEQFEDHVQFSTKGNKSQSRKQESSNRFESYTEPSSRHYDGEDDDDEFHVHTNLKLGGGI
jgi:hypothetical protein